MPEFAIKGVLNLAVSGVAKIKSDVNKAMKDVSKEANKAVDDIVGAIPGMFGRIVSEMKYAFDKIRGYVKAIKPPGVTMPGVPAIPVPPTAEALEAAAPEAAAGAGAMSGIMAILGPIAAIAVGIGVAVTILNGINDKLKKQIEVMKESSPAFKSIDMIQKKIWSLVMKPFGDFLSILMRPYIILSMNVIRQSLKKAADVLKALKAGAITQPEAMDQLQEIFAATYLALMPLMQGIKDATAPLTGFLAAFEDSVGIVQWFNDSLQNFVNYLAGLGKTVEELSKSEVWKMAAEMLGKAVKDNVDLLSMLPPKWREAYNEFKDLPGSVGDAALGLTIFGQTTGTMATLLDTYSAAFNKALQDATTEVDAFKKALQDALDALEKGKIPPLPEKPPLAEVKPAGIDILGMISGLAKEFVSGIVPGLGKLKIEGIAEIHESIRSQADVQKDLKAAQAEQSKLWVAALSGYKTALEEKLDTLGTGAKVLAQNQIDAANAAILTEQTNQLNLIGGGLPLKDIIKTGNKDIITAIKNIKIEVSTPKGGFTPSITPKGSKQLGGVIPETGYYWMHRKEEVLRAGEARARETPVSYSPNITINARIDSEYDIKKLATDLNRELQRRIRSRQPGVPTVGGI
jgi:hypothetical protein